MAGKYQNVFSLIQPLCLYGAELLARRKSAAAVAYNKQSWMRAAASSSIAGTAQRGGLHSVKGRSHMFRPKAEVESHSPMWGSMASAQ